MTKATTIFRDAAGRDWDCAITVAGVRRVIAGTGINLANLTDGDPSPLTLLSTNPLALCDVLWYLLRPVAESRGLKQPDVDALFDDGQVAAAAYDAFWEGVQLFFRSRNQPAVVKTIQAQMRAISAAHKEAEAMIDQAKIETAIQTKIGELREAANAKMPGLFASSSPASLE